MLEENRRHLAARGQVVYLETSVAQQAHRVRYGRHRPLIAQGDPAERLGQLMSARAALYADIADIIVCTDGRKVQHVAESSPARTRPAAGLKTWGGARLTYTGRRFYGPEGRTARP